jgi:hypothetical protein
MHCLSPIETTQGIVIDLTGNVNSREIGDRPKLTKQENRDMLVHAPAFPALLLLLLTASVEN